MNCCCRHVKSRHKNKKVYPCDLCEKGFNSSNYLHLHKYREHRIQHESVRVRYEFTPNILYRVFEFLQYRAIYKKTAQIWTCNSRLMVIIISIEACYFGIALYFFSHSDVLNVTMRFSRPPHWSAMRNTRTSPISPRHAHCVLKHSAVSGVWRAL